MLFQNVAEQVTERPAHLVCKDGQSWMRDVKNEYRVHLGIS